VRTRIVAAIVGVLAMTLLALGIPLAIAVDRAILDSEVVKLQAVAARTLDEVSVPLDPAQLARIHREADRPPPFSVYDTNGRLVFGGGPSVPDPPTRRALLGETTSATTRAIVVATPVINDADERVIGALRLTEPLDATSRRVRFAWLIMGVSGLLALGVGWLVAHRLARRLAQPVTDLAVAAARLGDGEPLTRPSPSGVAEIDMLTAALEASGHRVNDALARERRFSADVSHQLRTPLTAIRLRLHTVESSGSVGGIVDIVGDLDRIEATVDHLLSFARDEMPATSTVRLDEAARDAVGRWNERFESERRVLELHAPKELLGRGTRASLHQVLDVLIHNALRHGEGTVTVATRSIEGGAVIDVGDEGATITPAASARIFHRGEGIGTGIGLALARSLVEADGGRLLLSHLSPTTFSLVLLSATAD
jgi:signal transduction histidine kinase